MSIVDGRTPLDNADASTNWNDFASGTSISVDTDTAIEGSGSIAETNDSTSVWQGVMFDNGSNRDWAGEHVYFWFNHAAAGLVAEFAVRAMTSSGNDTYIQRSFALKDFGARYQTYTGGWIQFVVSVDKLVEQYDFRGVTGVPSGANFALIGLGARLITGVMPKKQDNLFLDAAYRLPANTPGIRVEGDNGGVPWTWQDILDWSLTNKNGLVREVNGVLMLNAPIQFGDSGSTSSTAFSDASGKIVTFTDDDVDEDFFKVTFAGNSTGTTEIDFGAVVGSGDDRRGSGGGVLKAGLRPFTLDAETDIADLDTVNFYGMTFQGMGVSQFSGSTKEDIIGCTFFDCGEVQPNDAEFLNNTVIAPRNRGLEIHETNNVKQIDFIAGEKTQTVETFGTPTVSVNAAPGNPYTFSHTVATGSDNVALLVLLAFDEVSAGDVLYSVTYNGEHLKLLGTASNLGMTASAWILYNPTENSSQTISVEFSGTILNVAAKAINLRGVPDVGRIRTAASRGGSTTTIDTNIVADNENDFSIDMAYVDLSSAGGTGVATAGDATETNDAAVGSEAAYFIAEVTGGLAGVRDHDWSWTGSATTAVQIVVLFPEQITEHHVHFPDSADYSLTFEGMQFFGFGAAGAPKWHGENSGLNADVTLNASESANPLENEFENIDGGTVTVVNTVNVTFSGMQDGTEIRIYAQGTTTELAGIENATDGSADDRSFTASLTAATVVDIRFAHTDVNGDTWIVPPKNSILNFTWPSSNTTIPITQVADRVFNNP